MIRTQPAGRAKKNEVGSVHSLGIEREGREEKGVKREEGRA
jgi:hypothetical protein